MMITCPNGHQASASLFTGGIQIRGGRQLELAGNQWRCPKCEVLWEIAKDPQTGLHLIVLNPSLVRTKPKSRIRGVHTAAPEGSGQ